MRVSRATYGLALIGFSLAMTGCGSISRGLGSVTSEGLVDEYAIPQNRSLAYPTDRLFPAAGPAEPAGCHGKPSLAG